MAYNYNTFNPYYPNQQMFPTQMSGSLQPTQMASANSQTQPSSPIIWVQGIEAAKSFLVAPGNTVQLWDSEAQIIYLKSADASGMPSIKVLDYTIRENSNAQPVQTEEYATLDDLNELKKQVEALTKKLKTTKEVKSNE